MNSFLEKEGIKRSVCSINEAVDAWSLGVALLEVVLGDDLSVQ